MNRKIFVPIKVLTDHPHPTESPDYLNPAGSIEDNSSFTYFIHELDALFSGFPYGVLDIGCAGGQFVVDVYNKGYPWLAVGLEGGNVFGMTGEFDEPRHHETGTLHQPRGAENWKLYHDKCLFHADVSKPFTIIDESENNSIVKFNIVTAWEFFEHPLPEEVPAIIDNIVKHLLPGGLFIGTINACLDGVHGHHRCAQTREWWDEMFASRGFQRLRYPFRSTPRTNMEFLLKLLERTRADPEQKIRFVDQEANPDSPDQYVVCYQLKGNHEQ